MGTTSSSPANARADLRRRAASGPQYPTPPGFNGAPQNNGQLYGGFQPRQQFAAPQFYGQQPRRAAPPPEPQEQTTRTTTIRNHVNLKKSTLQVAPASPGDPNRLIVKFTFDANVECWASVFLVATEHPKEGCRLESRVGQAPPARRTMPRGLGQTFVADAPIDVSAIPANELTRSSPNVHPLVVRLECITGTPESGEDGEHGGSGTGTGSAQLPEPAGAPLARWVQSQTTYASLVKRDDGTYGVTVEKQKIWVDGTSYELQEIFGIENCATGTPLEDGDPDGGKECVVCLSDVRDTTVLPCRHMCMCSGCARMLRHQSNRCPICRTPVESLLEIKVAPKGEGLANPA